MKFLLVLILCCFSSAVRAQEEEPILYTPYVSVKIGSGSIDLDGVSQTKNTNGFAIGIKQDNDGYHYRGEIEALFYGAMENKMNGFRHQTSTVMASAYYEFGQDRIKPFIGAGVGLAFLTDEFIGFKESELGFAGALNAGLSFELTDKIALEMQGRYTYIRRSEAALFSAYRMNIYSAMAAVRFCF